MDKKELESGLKNLAEGAEAAASAGASPLAGEMPPGEAGDAAQWQASLEWVLKNFGKFINNDRGIAELLLDKLTEAGVNTEGTAIALLVNVLQQFVSQFKALGKALGNNYDRINELSDKSESLAQDLEKLLKEMDVPTEEAEEMPLEDTGALSGAAEEMPPPDMGAGGMGEMPPDMGAAPPDMGAGGGMGMPPADMGAAPADMGADMGAAPADLGVTPAEPTPGTTPPPSDRRMKHVIVTRDKRRRAAPKATRISGGIISACSGGFQDGA